MNPGRNAPCPCGSGKKYKHCCLKAANATAESPETLTWCRVRRAIDGLPNLLHRFTAETFGPTAIDAAWGEFVLDTDDEYTEFDPHTPHIQLFMPWFFHCWSPQGEETEGPSHP